MQISVRLFGSVREAAGVKELLIDLPEGATLSQLRSLLARQQPAIDQLGERLRVSVNFEIRSDDTRLGEGDEVALLPPVSGGSGAASGRCTLSDAPLDVGEVVKRVAGPDTGGVVTFLGTVRDSSRGREIRHLEYEAYGGMAEAEMEKIADRAAERWPGTRVAIAHRSGHLGIGDIAVVVVAASAHRAEAFDAARFAIDTLKERVPIWKKEVATDGEYWVEEHA